MESLLESLRSEWETVVRLTPRLVASVLILVVLLWVGRRVGRLVVRLLQRSKLTSTHRTFFQRLVTLLFGLLGLVIGLNLLGLQTAAFGLVAGGGITAVVLGFAFRGIGENFLAGFFLAFSRPFEVGDLIQSGEFQGQVRGIELRCTHIRTGDGRDVYIPSSRIFNDPLVNFTRDGLRRVSFVIGIDYGEDSARARELLLEAVRPVQHVLDDPPPAAWVLSNQAQYQELEVSFWIDVFRPEVRLPAVRSEAMERGRSTLKEAGFTLSSEVTTGVVLDVAAGLDARIARRAGEPEA